ncbi:hypothetical protein Tco_1095391 [Tanacetum coccineum]
MLGNNFLKEGEAKTTSTPTTQAQVTYVSESVLSLKFDAKSFITWNWKVEAHAEECVKRKIRYDKPLEESKVNEELEKFVGGRLYEGDLRLRQKNHMILSYDVLIIQVFTMKMEILLEPTSNKLMVEHAEYDESNTYVLERFNTTAGNPVKKILLKLNLSDHRKMGQTIKAFQINNQERYEAVGTEVASLQDAKFQEGEKIVLVDDP